MEKLSIGQKDIPGIKSFSVLKVNAVFISHRKFLFYTVLTLFNFACWNFMGKLLIHKVCSLFCVCVSVGWGGDEGKRSLFCCESLIILSRNIAYF